MSTEKTDGLVLRLADFSETSRVVTWFTREFGKIATIAKGAKRLKGPFESALDLLAQCRIVFIRKSSSGLDILTEAQLHERFTPHGRDLVSLYGGYYVAELLAGLTEDYDPHPGLYDQAVVTLTRLRDADRPRLTVIRFELVLLREIGHLPAWDACMACGTPFAGEAGAAFWVSQGGLICRDCQRPEYQQRRIQPGTVAILDKLAGGPIELLDRLDVSEVQMRELRGMLTAAISHVLGRRPKLLRYLQS